MASSSEIEKLEHRCAENPHGLTFAPLAEAYRKHGDLDRALEVLRAGRELHPDYIPASIVLGRCHLDRGELPEAERSFAHVLTLDPENVIALKALAELAEQEGRALQAERWLNLLLAVDPSNDEARSQLDRLRTGATTGAVDADAAAGPAIDVGRSEPDEEHAVMSTGGAEDSADAPAAPSEFELMVEQQDAEIVLTPAADSDYRADTPGALPDVLDESGERDVFDITAPPAPDADERREGYDPSDAAASGLEPVPDLMAEFGPGDVLAYDPLEPSEPESPYLDVVPHVAPVVTESMAELYLRQGHRGEALSIYRQLAERSPDDERLAELVARITAEVDAAPAAGRAYAAAQTGGRSVGELLRGVLAERLPAAPFVERPDERETAPEVRAPDEVLADAEDQGEPTRPADDHLTLGAVFGEEDAAAPPAVASPAAAGVDGADAGLSFDEFFGAPPAVEPDATRTSPPAPSGDPDDLDQFHAWLQSLKR